MPNPITSLLPAPFAWIEIPAGQVTLQNSWNNVDPPYIGAKGSALNADVTPFAMAKYPITHAQFAKFIEAGGYQQERWWTAEGWVQCGKNRSQPCYWQDAKFNGDEQPVVGVSWYEALAFCLWLSEVSGQSIMLPTNVQWQWAAQGHNYRLYPWGDEWDGTRCNNRVKPCTSDRTTPVTAYEGKGDSPFGVVDMAGNVWEWCLTGYKSGTHDLDQPDMRILYGGGWDQPHTQPFLTAHYIPISPALRYFNCGFRCVRTAI